MSRSHVRIFLSIALAALTLAAWTGVLMRFGMIYGMPAWAQNFGAVRHAHSHLMYFGWVTLALMALIWAELPALTGRPLPRGVTGQMTVTAVLALLSFPAFWSNGYGLTAIGNARLPLGSMAATLNGLTWFLFIALYVRATRGLRERPLPLQLWDWALALMGLASVGALGLVGTVMTNVREPLLQQIFLHQFLDLFAVGWFNLALLGLFWANLPGSEQARPPVFSLALLLIPTFLLGVSPSLLPSALFWVAALANAGAALALGVHGLQLWRRRRALPTLTGLALSGLASVLVIAFLLLWPGLWEHFAGGQMRVFYLHLFLLVWVSTALIGQVQRIDAASSVFLRRWVNRLWSAGALVMVGGLLGLGLAPHLGTPMLWWLHVAAWGSLAVAGAGTMLWIESMSAFARTTTLSSATSPQSPYS